QERGGRAAGDDRLYRLAIAHASAELLDQRPQRNAQRQLVVARTVHMAAEAVDARALALLRAVRGIHIRAVKDYSWYCGNRLHIVDDRRAAVEANHRRERRLQPWIAALAFERLQQRALLAADIGAR